MIDQLKYLRFLVFRLRTSSIIPEIMDDATLNEMSINSLWDDMPSSLRTEHNNACFKLDYDLSVNSRDFEEFLFNKVTETIDKISKEVEK